MSRRPSFSEKRRRKLTVRPQIDRLESRSTVTEPISVMGLASGAFGGLARLGLMQAGGGLSPIGARPAGGAATGMEVGPSAGRPRLSLVADQTLPIAIAPGTQTAGGGGGGAGAASPFGGASVLKKVGSQSALGADLADPMGTDASAATGGPALRRPAGRPGGGSALAPRGGSGSGAQSSTLAAIQGRAPLPRASSAPAASPTIPGIFNPGPPAGGTSSTPGTVVRRNASAQQLRTGASPGWGPSGLGAALAGVSGGSTLLENPSSLPYTPSGAQLLSFTYYPLYTLDEIQGSVLFPGGYQLATLDGNVDLRAQVKGTTGVSFSWDTSNLTDATGITTSGNGNYDLKFTWTTSNATATVDSVTLTATNGSSQQETQTYYFLVPAGSSSTNTGTAAWSGSLSPDTVLPGDQSWSSDMVSVDANSGAVDATIPLPSYNPNVPGLALTYDSLTADPRPIIVVQHALDGSQAVPSKVNATLTFNGTAGTTWYYNTSQFTPGDVQQIALQANATSLSTGRYSYSAQVVDQRTANTTTTYTGSTTVLNQSTSAFGAGWTLQGLEQITTATGGVILALGSGGQSLWFSGSPGTGGNYTTPAGDFSTLTKTASGYTRTLPDGTQITFNSSGSETATIDLNGLHTTYAYNGSNQLTTITDPYSKVTTFSYASGKLSTIKDPAGRLTTISFTGNNLTAVQQADGSRATYTYDGSGRMTQAKDPNGKVVTVAYDAADRAGTITRPDATTQTFSAFQEQGWTNSGTSGSPAAGTLLAESAANYTDPNGNLTQMRPDWYGLGTTGQVTDALGDVTTNDVNSSGLATVVIDRLNRISQYQYDSLGNVTQQTYPDGSTDQYTYNSYSEPLTHTDANGHTTSYTYDAHGNNTVIQDPLLNRTTMTYTANGRLQTTTDANNHTTTLQYDSQDRLTTTLFPDGTTNLYAYNSQGNTTKVTDGRGNATTYSYDALGRQTGMTDALAGHTTYQYDANGNQIAVTDPLNETTSHAYDSMNRLVTVTTPLGYQTVHAYDANGNETSVTDPMLRITTYVYNALNQRTEVIDPITGGTTTTSYDAAGEQLTSSNSQGTTTYTYSVRGFEATATDPQSNTTTYTYSATGQTTAQYQTNPSGGGQLQTGGYTYDANGRQITSEDALGDITTYTYDNVGNQTTVEDPNGNTVTTVYDSRNRVIETIEPSGVTVSYTYDGSGNQQTVTDALGHTTTTLYDALNRATTTVSAIGGTTTITYDAAGHEASLTDPVGNTTRWGYDANGRMTTLTYPNGSVATYVYDKDNELTDQTDANGRRTTYAYDAVGNKTGETWVGASPSEVITYTYNAENQMTGAADHYATLTFTYNSDGQLQTDTTSGPGTGQPTVTLTYTYNQLGQETSVSDSLSSQGITTYSYDNAQRLTTITTSYGGTAGPRVLYGYDSGGRLTSESRTIGGNGTQVNTTYTYDAANRQATITDWYYTPSGGGSGGSGALATYVYGYDQASRVTSELNAEGTATFTYDNANQLTAVGGSRTESYSYDLNGNRNATGYTTGTGNELTASPGYTYTYDADGNLVSQTNTSTHVTTSYTYDYRNRLTQVTAGGTIQATYTYDALDRRIGIKDNGSSQVWTVYDGTGVDAHPYADFSGASGGSVTERYLFGPGVADGDVVDQILARTSAGGTTAWYLTDKLGSVRDIVSSLGANVDHIVYDSFGNIVTETNTANGDRFKFAGMENDATTGQNYDRARYYDGAVGRFMEQDPLGFAAGDVDLYRYAGDDVTNATDPSGELYVGIIRGKTTTRTVTLPISGPPSNVESKFTVEAQYKVTVNLPPLTSVAVSVTGKREWVIPPNSQLILKFDLDVTPRILVLIPTTKAGNAVANPHSVLLLPALKVKNVRLVLTGPPPKNQGNPNRNPGPANPNGNPQSPN